MSLDPLTSRAADYSGYAFCFNDPLIFSDHSGEWPKLEITTEKTGFTIQRVYGLNFYFSTPAIVVPTYWSSPLLIGQF